MPTPFPGMDPYLERSNLWREVHQALTIDIQRYLTKQLRPHYRVAIEQYTYLSVMPPDQQQLIGVPDILTILPHDYTPMSTQTATAVTTPYFVELPAPTTITAYFLEIRETETQEVVTVIEILSPVNKVNPHGRGEYEEKRLKILGSWTNLVEIDLLRVGKPLPMMKSPKTSHYRIIISRYRQRPIADAYLFNINEAIPDIPIPLLPNDAEPILPLNQILHELYDQAGYDLVIDYYQPPPAPALAEADTIWLQNLLNHQHGG